MIIHIIIIIIITCNTIHNNNINHKIPNAKAV